LGAFRHFWEHLKAGPDHITPGTGYGPHVLPGRLRIGESATNCLYADSYMGYISVLVSGTTRARFGNLNGLLDYSTDVYGFACSKDATNYVAIDPDNGVRVAVGSGSAINVVSGGDITLNAVSGDGGTSDINFVCDSRTYTFRGGFDQDTFCLVSDTDGSGTIYIGYDIDTSTPIRPATISINSRYDTYLNAYDDVTHRSSIYISQNVADSNMQLISVFASDSAGLYLYANDGASYINVTGDQFYPAVDSVTTLGNATYCWVDVFTDVLTLHETTEPTDVANYGKIYTKSDNLVYFQDGAGTEHRIAYFSDI